MPPRISLRVTVTEPGSHRAPTEVVIDADSGTSLADLRAPLATANGPAGPAGPQDLYVGSTRLGDDALVGWPPLLDGAVLSWGRPATSAPTASATGPLRLEVTSGPDAGGSFPLTPGHHVVGRTAGSIRVADRDLSREHLLIEVSSAGATVKDLASTNGARLGSTALNSAPQPWPVEFPLLAGSSTFELRTDGAAPATTTPDGRGHLLVNRRPRLRGPMQRADITFPPVVPPAPRSRVSLLAMVIPLMFALPMAWLQHSPTYLLFGLMSPALMLGNLASERVGGRRRRRHTSATWEREAARARADLARAVEHEGAQLRAAWPDCARLGRTVSTPLADLWERQPHDDDFLALRLGLGAAPSQITVVNQPDDEPAPVLSGVPMTLPLGLIGVAGLVGDRSRRVGLTRALIAQLIGWHSPLHVVVAVLSADDEAAAEWSWLERTPHARGLPHHISALESLLSDRQATSSDPGGELAGAPAVVVIVDGSAALRSSPGLARLLRHGPAVGIYAICLDAKPERLPAECRAVIDLDGATLTDRGGAVTAFQPDQVSASWADGVARAMSPLRDATPDEATSGLPQEARLLELLGRDGIAGADPVAIADRWRHTPRSSVAVVGATETGAYAIDLRSDGPHILVGGTTGAGKSELLQTLIASLAIVNSPTELGFVLIDYKGGAAFEQCAALPHTLGLVTDLDAHLTERALASLGAELKRREALLRAAGATDLDDYVSRARPGSDPLPRLVIVIDEFRMLAQELPTFLDGMVRIAALGRSLGVHLVLATQRPSGIVTADIAANVNLRIALRVRDAADSDDVIESRQAATIDARTPGRAFARSGANPLQPFQTARVAGPAADPGDRVRVVVLGGPAVTPAARPEELGSGRPGARSDLALIVDATTAAAAELGLPPTPSPWLPPLPDVVTLTDLARAEGGWRVPYAVVDRPAQQAQQTFAWDLERDSHLLVMGMPRSGRTSCLRTLAGSIARSFTPGQVHLHVIDGGGGSLLSLARLPHSGVVTGREETTRAVHLLERLAEEVERRHNLLRPWGLGSIAEQHAHATPSDRLPYVVLLIDGWEQMAGDWEHVEHGRPIEVVHQLIRDGAAVGIRIVMSGDRGLLLSRLASSVGDKIVLRLADPTELMMAGVPAAATPAHQPPGRGINLADHAEVQIALLATNPAGPAQIGAVEAIGAGRAGQPIAHHQRPLRIEPLPRAVSYSSVVAAGSGSGQQHPCGWALIGVGGDAVEPVGLITRGTSTLIAGPPRSGRSTALLTLSTWLVGQGERVVALTSGRSPLSDLVDASADPDRAGIRSIESADSTALRDHLERWPASHVLVDDAERLLDSEAEDVVLQWFKRSQDGLGSLVVAGTTADFTASFRGLSVVARRSGQGLLLSPTSYADGELFGLRLPATPASQPIPGRGLLITVEGVTPVQVASS